MGTKAVRFSSEDEKLINEFIKKNPMFDFSTLARISILNFIENPKVNLNPINKNNSIASLNETKNRSIHGNC